MRRHYHSLTAAERSERRWRGFARPPVPQDGSRRALDARNVTLARAYCDWSDIEEVVRMYAAAALMTELTGVLYVVDHSVPVTHPLVCGLHTHTNMQVITQRENRFKSNWLWPDMWPMAWDTMQLLEDWQEEQQEDRLEAAHDHQDPGIAEAFGRAGA